MYLLKQRLIGGGDKEPADFKPKKKECLAMRDGLKKCEKTIKAWMDGAEKMSSAASNMAELAKDGDADLERLGKEISDELGPENSLKICKEAIESIQQKIKLIDKLKKECADLDEKRLIMNRLKRKADEAQKKDDPALSEKATREHEEAVHAHAYLFAGIDGSFEFLMEADSNSGGVGLAKPEMAVFKRSTVQFFQKCNSICDGVDQSTLENIDLGTEWKKFNDRKDDKVDALRDDKMTKLSSRTLGEAESNSAGSASRLGTNESYHTAESSSGSAAPPPPPPPPPSMGTSTASAPPPPPPSAGVASGQARPPPPPAPSSMGSQAARPPPPPKPTGPQATAMYAYAPQNPDELALNVGDVITVTKQEEDGWWEGVLANGSRGVFPSNYVQLAGDDDDEIDSDYEGNV
ncbi:SH3 domain-containing kinase-binding protein 1 [Hondaea fermentalgiana]|uniref:SH3 domain-containing kinase-binding protein 1 n=1 Tax=Hondaea fermentalgiana TaxID=2315210 RepID=A0A2R5H356_9STRA|nr:SH3 domain-containing kinase-binding protein 1 [Hondaea fermentalgiana]|eukprot:GBG34844.1 SH3 domain-containing kinase-binding protein 1 [Hondaea fermentalgiana]